MNRPRAPFTFIKKFERIDGTGARNDQFHFHYSDKASALYNGRLQFRLDMSEKPTLEIEDRSDRWRFTCPRGHRSWEPTNHHFWCASCARADDVDGEFHKLRDQKTGRVYPREGICLQAEGGPFDPELDEEAEA